MDAIGETAPGGIHFDKNVCEAPCRNCNGGPVLTSLCRSGSFIWSFDAQWELNLRLNLSSKKAAFLIKRIQVFRKGTELYTSIFHKIHKESEEPISNIGRKLFQIRNHIGITYSIQFLKPEELQTLHFLGNINYRLKFLTFY